MARPSKSKKVSTSKGRYWSIIFYPESMPSNWESIIKRARIRCVRSPLHDRDGWYLNSDYVENSGATDQKELEKFIFNSDENACAIDENDTSYSIYTDIKGNEYRTFVSPNGLIKIQKKPHYHLLLAFKNPVTKEQACELSKKLGSNGIAQYIRQPYASYLYLTHKDDPIKAIYNEDDLCFFNEFKWYEDIKILDNEIIKEWREAIKSFVNEKSICSFVDLENMLRELADKEGYRPELYYYVDTHQTEWDRYCRANETSLHYQNKFTKKIDDLEDELKKRDIQLDKQKDEIKELKNRLGEEIFARNNPHLSKPKIDNEPPIDF